MRHVIIGTGAAGAAAARAIRREDRGAEVIVLGEEPYPPYNRCLLTDFLCDEVSREQLFDSPDPSLGDVGAGLRTDVQVARVDPAAREVHLEGGETLGYDRLLIATGRRPVVGDTLRPFADHIQNYYTLDDVLRIKSLLPRIEHAVVSGQTVSTLNLLSGLSRLGKRITYIIRGPRVDIPLVGAATPADLDAAINGLGAEIVREDRIVSVAPAEGTYRVETYQGREYDADVVFAAESYRPSLQCIRGTGIEVNRGILVDLELHTSAEYIYAAGDCVEIYHPTLRNYWVNFGWPNAVEQGTVAGANMAGRHETYRIRDTLAFDILGKNFEARWWQ